MNRFVQSRCWVLIPLLASLIAERAARADWDDLVVHVPPRANALVLIDAANLEKTALAKSEDWAGHLAKGHPADGLLLPQGTSRIVVGAALDFQYLHPEWQASVVEMDNAPSPALVANRDGGSVDLIGTHPTVLLNGDAALVEFDRHVVGVMSPANRQRLAEWLNYHGESLGSTLSPYLEQAAADSSTASGQIVLAFDLRHLLSPAFIRSELDHTESVRDAKLDLDQLSELLAGVQGVTVRVLVDDARHGTITIEFAADVAALNAVAKPLLLETLANAGARISDLDSWTATVAGKTVTLQGNLSEGGLRRLVSLVPLPTQFLVDAQTAPATPTDVQNQVVPYASLAYFRSIRKLFEDISAEKERAKTLGQIALWYDMYARRIDGLPEANVDQQLLDYGAGTAAMLRQAALALRGVGIESHEKEMQIYPRLSGVYVRSGYPRYNYTPYSMYGYGRPYSRYGYTNALYFQYRNVAGERRAAHAQAIEKGATSENQIMEEIANATTKVREAMSEKFQIDF